MVTTVVVIAVIVAIWFVLTLVLAKRRYNKASQIRRNAYNEVQNFTRAYSSNRNIGNRSLQYPSTMGVEMAKKEDKRKTKTTNTKSRYSSSSSDHGSGYADYGSSYDSGSSSSYDSGSSSSSSDSGSSGGGCD